MLHLIDKILVFENFLGPGPLYEPTFKNGGGG